MTQTAEKQRPAIGVITCTGGKWFIQGDGISYGPYRTIAEATRNHLDLMREQFFGVQP